LEISGQLHALATGEIAPGAYWVGDWVDLRTDLGVVMKRKIPDDIGK
jgi:hypothetical protein